MLAIYSRVTTQKRNGLLLIIYRPSCDLIQKSANWKIYLLCKVRYNVIHKLFSQKYKLSIYFHRE